MDRILKHAHNIHLKYTMRKASMYNFKHVAHQTKGPELTLWTGGSMICTTLINSASSSGTSISQVCCSEINEPTSNPNMTSVVTFQSFILYLPLSSSSYQVPHDHLSHRHCFALINAVIILYTLCFINSLCIDALAN